MSVRTSPAREQAVRILVSNFGWAPTPSRSRPAARSQAQVVDRHDPTTNRLRRFRSRKQPSAKGLELFQRAVGRRNLLPDSLGELAGDILVQRKHQSSLPAKCCENARRLRFDRSMGVWIVKSARPDSSTGSSAVARNRELRQRPTRSRRAQATLDRALLYVLGIWTMSVSTNSRPASKPGPAASS